MSQYKCQDVTVLQHGRTSDQLLVFAEVSVVAKNEKRHTIKRVVRPIDAILANRRVVTAVHEHWQ